MLVVFEQCSICEIHFDAEFELYEFGGRQYCMDCLYNRRLTAAKEENANT